MTTRQVSRYDGQTIHINGQPAFELGNYLGGGAAGVVYEAVDCSSRKHFAIKILHPIGFKLTRSQVLSRYIVAIPGTRPSSDCIAGNRPFTEENVRWLVHPSTKQIVAAYEDPHLGSVRELPLPRCVEIWGWDLPECRESCTHFPPERMSGRQLKIGSTVVTIPRVPAKYVHFVRSRSSIYREIKNMSKLSGGEDTGARVRRGPNGSRSAISSGHANVLRLEQVLELLQDSKSTMFLVLELASGGELFDRIRVDEGCDEDTARSYFRQLLAGVDYCHRRGVCHRDLKPENLLLADNHDGAVLKIADFGLSALFDVVSDASSTSSSPTLRSNGSGAHQSAGPTNKQVLQLKRLRSVVGSPHYVAPEVLDESGHGYDGDKADVWSLGVILYAMLAGNLPFGKDLLQCPRFEEYAYWHDKTFQSRLDATEEEDLDAESASELQWRERHRSTTTTNPQRVHQHHHHQQQPQFLSQSPNPTRTSLLCQRVEQDEDVASTVARASRDRPRRQDHARSSTRRRPSEANKEYPSWFFPRLLSEQVKSLIVGLLNPHPSERTSIAEALRHPWVRDLVREEWLGDFPRAHTLAADDLDTDHCEDDEEEEYEFNECVDDSVAEQVELDEEDDKVARSGRAGGVVNDDESASWLEERKLREQLDFQVALEVYQEELASLRLSSEETTTTHHASDPDVVVEQQLTNPVLPECALPGVHLENNAHLHGNVAEAAPTAVEDLQQSEGVVAPVGLMRQELERSAGRGDTDPRNSAPASPLRAENKHPSHHQRAGSLADSVCSESGFSTPRRTHFSRKLSTSICFNSPPIVPTRLQHDVMELGEQLPSLLLAPVGSSPQITRQSPGRSGMRLRGYSSERSVMQPSSQRRLRSLSPVARRNAGSLSPLDFQGSPARPSHRKRHGAERTRGRRVDSDTESLHDDSEDPTDVPVFQDLVKRSTRFSTCVPAREVLEQISDIVQQIPFPLKYPFSHIEQRAVVDWDKYTLTVTRGGTTMCTVRVFLVRAGLYMVEFLRGNVNIFEFKHFYETLRERLSEIVKNDYTLALLDSGASTQRNVYVGLT